MESALSQVDRDLALEQQNLTQNITQDATQDITQDIPPSKIRRITTQGPILTNMPQRKTRRRRTRYQSPELIPSHSPTSGSLPPMSGSAQPTSGLPPQTSGSPPPTSGSPLRSPRSRFHQACSRSHGSKSHFPLESTPPPSYQTVSFLNITIANT